MAPEDAEEYAGEVGGMIEESPAHHQASGINDHHALHSGDA